MPQELSTYTYIGLELTKALVPAIVAIGGGLWVAFTYVDNQRRAHEQQAIQAKNDNITRLVEARKPFASVQLQLFIEAGKVAGELAAFDKSNERWMESAEWKAYYTRFYQLFWTELSIVEDDEIKAAMQEFSGQLNKVLSQPHDIAEQKELNQVAYRLARKIRASIEKTWMLDLGPLTGPTKE
jgi:hypothetical protein